MRTLLLIALLLQQQTPPATTGTVSGMLLYSDGTAPLGMMIRLTPAAQSIPTGPPSLYTFVNATGAYTLRAPAGQYFIQAASANAVYYPGVVNQSEATPVIVTAGSTNSGLNFSLPLSSSGVRVQGRIVLPENYPLPTATLEVWLSRQPGKVAADGTFEFTHVMPGAYPVSVSAAGSQPVLITVSDRDITGIQIPVPPMIPVHGVVTLEGTGARPRFNLLVEGLLGPGMTPALMPNGPFRTSVSPRPDGSFSTSLPPGEYRIAVTNLASGYYLKTIASGETELMGKPLKVAASDESIKLVVTTGMSSGVRIAGRVTRSDSENTSTFPEKVTLTGVAVPDTIDATLNSDGTFQIPKILPGTYFGRVSLGPGLSSAPVSIVIPNRDLSDLEIQIPAPRRISGKVAVDGNGPPPKFPLLLVRGANTFMETQRPGGPPSLSVPALINTVLGGGTAGSQVLQLDINALPDGSFSLDVPDGEYQVLAMASTPQMNLNGIPPAYFLRSLTSNSADLLKESLIVSEKETPEIHIGLGTTAPNPWVRVSGRVKGLDSARGAIRVALESSVTSRIETFVDAEGKFEFPVVLQRTRYTARLLPADDAASTPRINVEDKDVANVEIAAPAKREVTARVVVEGNYPVPSVGLTLDAKDSSITAVIRPDSDGTARIKLPEDERTVRPLSGLPMGYTVKSITYGSANLLRQPLRLAESAAAELAVTLAVDPAIAWGSLRGKVTGLDLEKGSARIVLNGVSAYARFETTLNADGSFNFARLPQGSYIPILEGDVTLNALTPSSIVVSGTELAGLEIVAVQSANPKSPRVEESPRGATLSDFPGSSRAAANESAAVANLRTVNTALVTFLSASGGRYGNLQDLIGAGLLDTSFNGTKSGFNFSIIATGKEYAAAAVPANSATARYGYYSTPDAVIRYSTFEALAPSQQGGRPVQ
jgi:hypothetical protein